MRSHLFFACAIIVSTVSCEKLTGLSRDNLYDTKRDNDYNLVLTGVNIVEENINSDGQLQSLEDMYVQIFIGNTGTEPGRISNILIMPVVHNSLYLYPNDYHSSFSGFYVAENFVEPGTSLMLDNGATTPGGSPYSIKINKGALSGGAATLDVELKIQPTNYANDAPLVYQYFTVDMY